MAGCTIVHSDRLSSNATRSSRDCTLHYYSAHLTFRRVAHAGPHIFFIVDGRRRNFHYVLNDASQTTPVANELLQLTGNPQAPFDDDESLPSLEPI